MIKWMVWLSCSRANIFHWLTMEIDGWVRLMKWSQKFLFSWSVWDYQENNSWNSEVNQNFSYAKLIMMKGISHLVRFITDGIAMFRQLEVQLSFFLRVIASSVSHKVRFFQTLAEKMLNIYNVVPLASPL